MKYDELNERVKKAYAKVRNLDDYYWNLEDGRIIGIHKKSELNVRIKFAANREEAEKISKNKEGEGIDIIVVPEKNTFYLYNGAFILSSKFLRSTLIDINDHIIWHGFKVIEDKGKLIQEDFYEYLGGLLINHLRNSMLNGQDYLLWQFYKCEECGKYVDIDSVARHMKREHGIDVANRSEVIYEVFELNFVKGKIFNKFGKEVKEEQFSREAKEFIKEMFKNVTPVSEKEFEE